jgi:hypothetical protein
VDHGDSVVPEETPEEKDPPTPQPPAEPQPYSKQKQTAKSKPDHVEPNGTRVGDYIALLTNAGHEGVARALTPADKAYLHEQQFDIPNFVACVVDCLTGHDEWIKKRLTVRNVHQYRYTQWLARRTAATGPYRPEPGGLLDSSAKWLKNKRAEEDARDARGVSPALPAPAHALRTP